MKRFLAILSALMLSVTFSVSAFAEDAIVTVDMSTTYQTIDGFGASYTWYGDWLTGNDNAEQGYDWIFNEAEFNILRFRDLNHVGGEYQNALDGYPAYYAYYKAACDRGVDPLVLVTSWGQYDRDLSWVAYTELSDKGFSYYTLAKDKNGEYMYDELAKFCVQSIQYFYDAGIPVDYFSISNEIELQERHVDENGNARNEAGFFFGQEEDDYHCCYWKAHIAVYNAFKEAFGEYAPILLGAETMAGYQDLLHGYLDPVVENCPESLEIIGHHLYGTDLSEKNLRQVGENFSDYRIWQTEWYNNNFFEHAGVMIDELVYEGVSGYLYWNGVWIFDTGNCLIEIDGAEHDKEFRRMGNHYLMTHFSKYIKRGYQRVEISGDLKSKLAAFKAPDDSKLVVIALNRTDLNEFLTLDIGGKKILSSEVIVSTEGENRFSNKYLQDGGEYEDGLVLAPNSLNTIVIDLEPNPNYVAPVVETKINPYVKTPGEKSDGGNLNIVYIAVAAVLGLCVCVITLALRIASMHTKKIAKKELEDEQ